MESKMSYYCKELRYYTGKGILLSKKFSFIRTVEIISGTTQ